MIWSLNFNLICLLLMRSSDRKCPILSRRLLYNKVISYLNHVAMSLYSVLVKDYCFHTHYYHYFNYTTITTTITTTRTLWSAVVCISIHWQIITVDCVFKPKSLVLHCVIRFGTPMCWWIGSWVSGQYQYLVMVGLRGQPDGWWAEEDTGMRRHKEPSPSGSSVLTTWELHELLINVAF